MQHCQIFSQVQVELVCACAQKSYILTPLQKNLLKDYLLKATWSMVMGMPLMTQPSPTLRCLGIENELTSVVIVSSRKSMRGVTLFTPLDEDISLFGISLKA